MKKILLILLVIMLVGCAKSVEDITDIDQTDIEQPVPVIDHSQESGKVKLNIIEPETIETNDTSDTIEEAFTN